MGASRFDGYLGGNARGGARVVALGLFHCAKSPDVVVAYLRSARPVYLARLEARAALAA